MEPGSLHTVRAILIFLNDGVEQAQPFFVCPELKDDALQQLESAGAKTAIAKLLEQRETDSWSGEDLDRAKTLLGNAAKEAGVKKGVVMKSFEPLFSDSCRGPI